MKHQPLFHVGKRRDGEPAFLYCGPCRGFTEHRFHGERPIGKTENGIPFAWQQLYRCACGATRTWGVSAQFTASAAKAA